MGLSSRSILLICLLALILFTSRAHAFGAGNIASISKLEGQNWRHGDIEDLIKQVTCIKHHKWSSMMVKRVYFGNWLRDYSQAMDTGALKKAQPETIRILVWLLSFLGFGYATAEFEVTSERLGVYRPEEHIDNPKDYNDNQDARPYDSRLRAPVRPVEIEIDPQTGMKNYIANGRGDWATSAAYVKHSFEKSIEYGRQYISGSGVLSKGKDEDLAEALRLLGQGLHTLEDFGAHTNYIELSLIELGYRKVFAHVGRDTGINLHGKQVFPLVTGTFGMVDFYHSVLGEATDHFAQSELNEMDNAMGVAEQAATSSNPLTTLVKLLSKVPGTGGLIGEAERLQATSQAAAKRGQDAGGWAGSSRAIGNDIDYRTSDFSNSRNLGDETGSTRDPSGFPGAGYHGAESHDWNAPPAPQQSYNYQQSGGYNDYSNSGYNTYSQTGYQSGGWDNQYGQQQSYNQGGQSSYTQGQNWNAYNQQPPSQTSYDQSQAHPWNQQPQWQQPPAPQPNQWDQPQQPQWQQSSQPQQPQWQQSSQAQQLQWQQSSQQQYNQHQSYSTPQHDAYSQPPQYDQYSQHPQQVSQPSWQQQPTHDSYSTPAPSQQPVSTSTQPPAPAPSQQQIEKPPAGLPGLPDFDPAKTIAQIYPILAFRDRVVRTLSSIIEKIPGLEALVDRIVETLTVFIFSLLAPFVRPIISVLEKTLRGGSDSVATSDKQHQYEVWDQPRCSDPTHSMLSKDHFSNILNDPAGHVAGAILKFIAPRVLYAWEHPEVPIERVKQDIDSIFHHPAIRDERGNECHRSMFQAVRTWAESQPNRGSRLEDLLNAEAVRKGKNHILEIDNHAGHGSSMGPTPTSQGAGSGGATAQGGYQQYFQSASNVVSGLTGHGGQQHGGQSQQSQSGIGGILNQASSFLGSSSSNTGGSSHHGSSQQQGGLNDMLSLASHLPGVGKYSSQLNTINKLSSFIPGGGKRELPGDDGDYGDSDKYRDMGITSVGGGDELYESALRGEQNNIGRPTPSPGPMPIPSGYEIYTTQTPGNEYFQHGGQQEGAGSTGYYRTH